MNTDNTLIDIFSIPAPQVKYQSKLQEYQGRRYLDERDIVWLTKPKLIKFIEQAKKDAKKYQQELAMYTPKHPKFTELRDKHVKAHNIVVDGTDNLEFRVNLAKCKKELKMILDANPFLDCYPSPASENLDDNYPWKNQSQDCPDYETELTFYLRDSRYLSAEYDGLNWEEEGYGFYETASFYLEDCIDAAHDLIEHGNNILKGE
tara:strand:- start:88 stop:702 length:615 start_codon:yes stop_codon:yes gene_type:complete